MDQNVLEAHKKTEHRIKFGKLAFQTKSKLITHMNLVHEELTKPFEVRGEEMLQKYIKQISNGKNTKCPMCKVIFMDLEDLNDHMEMFCTDTVEQGPFPSRASSFIMLCFALALFTPLQICKNQK